ncbi:MAG: glycosyltransferase [Bacteroidales bacterium]|nr:glycosyltransferase [Bacteroidales bacterium]MBN2818454.1 glycosyltransferase [Bacteroidales bacterium]
MDLSIVIVNYNVKHFLEQCLHSVEKAKENLETEVFVVDNNSVDGSCQMVEEKFPWVKLIANKENLGFSKANNQAIRMSKGRYVLLLNPDTFVQEDTLQKCVQFADNNEDLGGLGVKMIDGKGNFLPESKRALPTPAVAFYKIFGLSSLFPKSKIFGKYHLGYLNRDEVHKVEILAGAFMMLRKSLLDKIGLLDETFFMYGEDIDLSYRIVKAGYQNYYFPDSPIIHYKGESTKKGSINYVMVFYKAMIIFAQKHFSANNAKLYSLLINIAIYLRATFGIMRRVFYSTFEPLVDFIAIYSGFWILTTYWEKFRFGTSQYYPKEFLYFVAPAYTVIWMFFLYLFGGYEKRIKPLSLVRGVVSGLVLILLIYALLPESLRFSRALILLGAVWTTLMIFIIRLLGGGVLKSNRKLSFGFGKKRIAIVGSDNEAERVTAILKESKINYEFIGRVAVDLIEHSSDLLGTLNQLDEIIKINKIDELVFCSQDIQASDIINSMLTVNNSSIDFKIAPPESVSVIGSNSINTAGDLYVVDINSLSKGVNKRKKRMFDMVSGLSLLILSPILIFTIKRPAGFLSNCFKVISGKYTWVGVELGMHQNIHKEELRRGILNAADTLESDFITPEIKQRMNVMYAKDYKVGNDLIILMKCFRSIGGE